MPGRHHRNPQAQQLKAAGVKEDSLCVHDRNHAPLTIASFHSLAKAVDPAMTIPGNIKLDPAPRRGLET
jgi:hypothetical protein